MGDRNVNVHGPNYGLINTGDVNVNQAPTPELKIGTEEQSENADGTFRTRIPAEVISPYPPADLYIEVHAPGILSLDVKGQHPIQMNKQGVRPNFVYHIVQHPSGRYTIEVVTRERVNVLIKYQFG